MKVQIINAYRKQRLTCLSTILLVVALFLSTYPLQSQTTIPKDTRMEWWRDATLGMFIHWGLYAIPAGEWDGKTMKKKDIGEWIMHRLDVPINDYEKLASQFNPTSFNAKEWVKMAKDAGMKYIVITSKHHDGFCLWDSKVSKYDIMDASPFKRDILRELTDAANEAGIKMCFYHSIMDWHQPDAESPKDYTHQHNPNADWNAYRENYLKPQLKELVQNYHPAVLWFDGEWIPEWTEEQGADLYHFLMNLDPHLIINNRIGKGRKGMHGMNAYDEAAGDFGTPEQEILEGTADMDWESCMTMNDTWGFRKDDHNWKSSEELVKNLIEVTAKGGNYLLNIGPKATGEIPDETVTRLRNMGMWLKKNGKAIYATTSLKKFKDGEVYFTKSKDGASIYAIVTERPDKILSFALEPGISIKSVSMLTTGKMLNYKVVDGKIMVNWPADQGFEIAEVVVLGY